MSELTEAELLMAAKNRAWEVIRRWRGQTAACDDETLAAMVAKVVLGQAGSAEDAAGLSGRTDE